MTRRLQIRVAGQVQGVGFRPFVWNRAVGLSLTGSVWNNSEGVLIEVQGAATDTNAFLEGFAEQAPPLAVIRGLEAIEATVVDGESDFVIDASRSTGPRTTPTTPDTAICADCLREMLDEHDRRYGYPFINCTNCGPRFTIVKDIPYDRPNTTMHEFAMCAACRREYEDPTDRRFHAQPNACADCGPRVWYIDRPAEVTAFPTAAKADSEGAITSFGEAIRGGAVVAVKGIGGFHLACDANNPQAIQTLRDRKRRGDKPLALLAGSAEQAEQFAVISPAERRLLECKERPIVLLRKRRNPAHAAMLDRVAPRNDFVGVMLPYSPLHVLLIRDLSPLVMTSGNLSDEPIARTNDEARTRLRELADGFLLHDREVHAVCDDSVVRRIGDRLLPIRRSRGYTPAPIALPEPGPTVLAVGGELKAAFCLCHGRYAYPSQHIGDVGNLETLDALGRAIDHYQRLYRAEPAAVAADLHPNYLSAQWARRYATELGVPFVGVQHHHAHAVSLAVEAGWNADKPLLVCCFDGTGYGLDEAIWGGEFFVLEGRRIDRVAHLRYFPLPGGDASVKRPYRSALALLHAFGQAWDERLACVAACPEAERRVLAQQLSRGLNCVATSSAGRLFDAVAAIIGGRQEVDYEAQAAMELEALAQRDADLPPEGPYAFALGEGQPIVIDPEPTVHAVRRDAIAGRPREEIAALFHHAVAEMVIAVAKRLQRERRFEAVGLTGGVLQNALLSELVEARCRDAGLAPITHSIVPPNDGGLSLGQAAIARRELAADG